MTAPSNMRAISESRCKELGFYYQLQTRKITARGMAFSGLDNPKFPTQAALAGVLDALGPRAGPSRRVVVYMELDDGAWHRRVVEIQAETPAGKDAAT